MIGRWKGEVVGSTHMPFKCSVISDKVKKKRQRSFIEVSLCFGHHWKQGTSDLLTYLLTPWSRVLLEKLTGFAANQEIPLILWNPKVHYRIHKRPPPVPILSQLHPVPITLSFPLPEEHFRHTWELLLLEPTCLVSPSYFSFGVVRKLR